MGINKHPLGLSLMVEYITSMEIIVILMIPCECVYVYIFYPHCVCLIHIIIVKIRDMLMF